MVRGRASANNLIAAVEPLWNTSVSLAKVNLRIVYAGFGFTLSDPKCNSLGCPYSGPSAAGECSKAPGLLRLPEIQAEILEDKLVPTALVQKL